MLTKQIQQTIAILHNFGFSAPEVEIYTAVLTMEKATVTQIARYTHRGRTAIYFHIKNLLDRGLLKETRQKTKLSLVALPPDDLSKLLERWSVDFKSLVPHLESLKIIEGEAPTIKITDSRRGYLDVLDEISALPTGSMFRVIEGSDALNKEIPLLTDEEWQNFFSRIIERKIETKGIFTLESTTAPKKFKPSNLELVRKRIWHLRTISEASVPIKDLILIYGNKVSIVFFETSLVLTIAHRGNTKAVTALFDGVFQLGQPFKW